MMDTLRRPPQDRRFKFGPIRIAFLLVLPAVGLGLFAGARELSAPRPSGSGSFPRSLTVAAQRPSLDKILAHPERIPSHDHPLLGRQAPDFELADAEGKTWNLRELRAGGSLLLIFYDGYHCPNCVRQLSGIHRDMPLFRAVGARVVAISADPAELTRQRFEQYGAFDFPVLADTANKVRQAYQVLRRTSDGKRSALLRHGTFIIDRAGAIAWVNVGDGAFRRNPALLSHLAQREAPLQRGP